MNPIIPDAEWLDYVTDFLIKIMECADANCPSLYASRIDGCLMPFDGRVS